MGACTGTNSVIKQHSLLIRRMLSGCRAAGLGLILRRLGFRLSKKDYSLFFLFLCLVYIPMAVTEAWIFHQSKGARFRNWFVVLEGIF